jgi:pimeloyl-ACP methyl ester carboxylesterase
MKKASNEKRGRSVYALVQVAAGVLVMYSAYCLLLFLFQRQLLFPRFQIETPSGMAQVTQDMEKMWLNTRCGRVEAWFLPPAPGEPAKPVPAVIFAHGNAELIDFWPQELSSFRSHGMGLLMVEYPGYGRSEGTPSQENIAEAFLAAYDMLVARKEVDPARIVLFGRSLGGGAVCALADQRPAAALVLMSTFTSVKSFASRFFVPGFLVKDPFDNLTSIASYSGPVLIMHGKHDSLIPYEHGVALYRAAQDAEMVTYDCDHNDCPPSWETFWQDVSRFLHNAGILENEEEKE